jgi:ribosomal protein S14
MPGFLNCLHPKCKNLYKNSADLLKHMTRSKKRRLKFDCVECGHSCASLHFLERHMKKHTAITQTKKPVHNLQSRVPCDVCGKFYPTIDSLNEHKKCHMQEQLFACDVASCSYSSKVNIDLWNHKRYVHSNNSAECHLCGKIIKNSRNGLKSHQQRHETGTEGLFKCVSHKGCKQLFTRAEDLKKHFLATQNGDIQRIALDCDEAFESEQNLDMHSFST